MVDEALKDASPLFANLYAETGRPSIAPERLPYANRAYSQRYGSIEGPNKRPVSGDA